MACSAHTHARARPCVAGKGSGTGQCTHLFARDTVPEEQNAHGEDGDGLEVADDVVCQGRRRACRKPHTTVPTQTTCGVAITLGGRCWEATEVRARTPCTQPDIARGCRTTPGPGRMGSGALLGPSHTQLSTAAHGAISPAAAVADRFEQGSGNAPIMRKVESDTRSPRQPCGGGSTGLWRRQHTTRMPGPLRCKAHN